MIRKPEPLYASYLHFGIIILCIYYCVFSQIFSMRLLPEKVEPFVPVLSFVLVYISYGGLLNKQLQIWFLPLVGLSISLVTHFNFGIVRDLITWGIGFLLITRAYNPRHYKTALNIFYYTGILYTLSVLFQFIFPSLYFSYYFPLFQGEFAEVAYGHWYGPQNIASGLSHQVGYTAGYIVVALGVYVFVYFKKTSTIQKLLILGTLVLGLLLCKKRMHFAAALLCAIIVYILGSKAKKRSVTTITVAIVGSIVLFLVITISDYIGVGSVLDRYATSFELESSGESLSSSRTALRLYAFNLWKENPIFGIGWNQFKEVNMAFTTSVHNVFLQLLCETGVVGTVLFLTPIILFLYKSIRLLIRKAGQQIAPDLSFSCFYQLFFFMYFFTGNPIYDYAYLIPYFVSVAISCYYINEERIILYKVKR